MCQKPDLPPTDKLLNFEKTKAISKATLKYEDYEPAPDNTTNQPEPKKIVSLFFIYLHKLNNSSMF